MFGVPSRTTTLGLALFRDQFNKLLDGLEPTVRDLDFVQQVTNLLDFPGWTRAENNLLEEIIRRLKEHAQAKTHLARHLADDLIANRDENRIKPRRVFIESGSTLAYFASELAQRGMLLPDSRPKPSVLTNNFLAQLSLFGVLNVGVTAGELRSTYLAYLPFAGGDRSQPQPQPTDSNSIDDEGGNVFLDRLAFTQLDRELSGLDTLYCTGSTFGWLVGPLSGTRDNAIFKFCLLNNRSRRRICFCIADAKVFASRRQDIPQWGYSLEQVQEHLLSRCFLVFDVEHSPRALKTQGVPDLFALLDTRVGKAPHRSATGIRSASQELGLTLRPGHAFLEGAPVAGAYRTWIQFLEEVPSRCVEIVIGCNDQATLSALRQDVTQANQVLSELGHSRRYVERPTHETTPWPVLHVDVVDSRECES